MMAVWENRRSQGADAIFGLVSGYATGLRESKPLAFLRAAIDDSASETGDKRLFMAGYLNTAENWALFADAWADELKAVKPISYLRMNEAATQSGQFQGWQQRDISEKLRGLIRVIRHFKPMSFHVSISRTLYFSELKPVAPRGLGNPHFVCSFGVIAQLASFVANSPNRSKIQFIFDQQDGVSDDLALFFDSMKNSIPRKARRLIHGYPMYENDKLFPPLQAADLLAWYLRANHERSGSWMNVSSDVLGEPHGCQEMDFKISEWAQKFSQIPGIESVQGQTKTDWRKFKRELRRVSALGFIPPYGTRLKNFLYASRSRIGKILDFMRGRS
jgi:hypothetical protein